jgi:hypothetical protein
MPWGLGEVFTTGDGRRLQIVDILPVQKSAREDLRFMGVWRVEPADV